QLAAVNLQHRVQLELGEPLRTQLVAQPVQLRVFEALAVNEDAGVHPVFEGQLFLPVSALLDGEDAERTQLFSVQFTIFSHLDSPSVSATNAHDPLLQHDREDVGSDALP